LKKACVYATLAAAWLLSAALPIAPALPSPAKVDFRVAYSGQGRYFLVTMSFTAPDGLTSIQGPEPPGSPGETPTPPVHITVEEAAGPQGSLQVTQAGSGWDIAGSGDVRVTYRVELGAPGGPSPEQGDGGGGFSSFLPHAGDAYVFIPGRFLFLRPDLEEAVYHASFAWPEGWEGTGAFSSPLTPEEAGGLAVFAGKLEKLDVAGSIPLEVAQPRDADPANLAAQEEFAGKLSSMLDGAAEAWGHPGLEGRRLTLMLGGVSVDPGYPLAPSPPGGSLDSPVFVPVGPRENILSTDLLLRAAEASLEWLLGVLRPHPSTLWFTEGCARYSSLALANRLGWLSRDEMYDRLAGDNQLYLEALAAEGRGPAEAGEGVDGLEAGRLLRCGGAVAAASIDAALRERGLSLDGSLARLLQGAPEEGLDGGRLRSELEAYSGRSFSTFFEEHIDGSAAIPASAFSRLKLEEGGDGGSTEPPLPSFGEGRKWIYMVVTAVVVFSMPFLLEPYTLRPRRGSVETDAGEEEEEEEGS
jgi:hypothetical protein